MTRPARLPDQAHGESSRQRRREPAGPGTGPDPDKIVVIALRVWGYKRGEVVSLMIHLGDRLGLDRALDGAGPVTAYELAARTGLHPRWLLEWLRCQASGLVDSADGQVFGLSTKVASLADQDGSVWFAADGVRGRTSWALKHVTSSPHATCARQPPLPRRGEHDAS